MEAKHLQLAIFLSTHPEGPWRERMEAWNAEHEAEHPGWHYRNESQFGRDATHARRRILDPGIRDAG